LALSVVSMSTRNDVATIVSMRVGLGYMSLPLDDGYTHDAGTKERTRMENGGIGSSGRR